MDFLRTHRIAAFVVCILLVLAILGHFLSKPEEELVTGTVEKGDVVSSVVVSGVARATEAVRLRFPDTGRIADILVSKGSTVTKGDVLALLDHADVDAERREAMAGLSRALAARDELVHGPTSEERSTISVAVENARTELERVRSEEAEKVAAARRIYLGSNLALVPENLGTDDVAPVVGGAYSCESEGTYTISVYRSGTASGYSYRISGLEEGTYGAYTEADGAFGTCGLTLRFDPDESYRPMSWTLAIPNTRGEQFITHQNALILAEEHERTAIEAANDTLTAALADASLDLSDPQNEALRIADSDIDAALARVARADALRERRVLRAPFTGTVTDIGPKIGEVTPATDPVVTLVSASAFEVIARVPEIDITKVSEGDQAILIFDAQDTEQIPAHIAFLSPLASPIDGVAYFDATVNIENVPAWLREGMNADVEILVDERTGVPRIPRRFLAERDGSTHATVLSGSTQTDTIVRVDMIGTDGYATVDLPVGTVVVAPELTP